MRCRWSDWFPSLIHQSIPLGHLRCPSAEIHYLFWNWLGSEVQNQMYLFEWYYRPDLSNPTVSICCRCWSKRLDDTQDQAEFKFLTKSLGVQPFRDGLFVDSQWSTKHLFCNCHLQKAWPSFHQEKARWKLDPKSAPKVFCRFYFDSLKTHKGTESFSWRACNPYHLSNHG